MPAVEGTPPYMQVVAALRAKIDSGELNPGDLLPSDREIAASWNISRATAQKAIAVLAAEGVVDSKVGIGTHVSQPAGRRNFVGHDRAASVRRTGRIYNQGEYARIVSAELVPAPAEVAEVLGIDKGALVIRRIRVTYSPDDQPMSASTSWFDGALAETAPKLLETERIIAGSWAYLEEQTGRTVVYGQDRITVRLATEEDAQVLNLAMPAAVKVAKTILRDGDSAAVEFGVSVSGGDSESIYEYDVSPAR